MSEHGRTGLRDEEMPDGLRGPQAVSRHRGTPWEFMDRHQRHVRHVLARGDKAALRDLAEQLLFRISDERTLSIAWNHLVAHGGQAPGPSGLRYSDLDDRARWQYLRELRDAIRAGEYTPGPERLRWIAKRSGKGKRPLIIQEIGDRVVQRAVVEIFQPVLDPGFDSRSFGFRPGRGPLGALATAEYLAGAERRWIWVAVDLQDAFQHVPISRLLDIIRMRLPDGKLQRFIECILRSASLPGLRQGAPGSPILLNVYLDHFLDRSWRKRQPTIPLIRFADDILLLCRSRKEAVASYEELVELLQPTAMMVKEGEEQAVHDLQRGQPVTYMGYHIGWDGHRPTYTLTANAWGHLGESLEVAHEAPASAKRASEAVVGWLGQQGPCLEGCDIDAVHARIVRLGRRYAFDELPHLVELRQVMEQAIGRWQAARQRAGAARGGRLGLTEI